jgi:hypothetical protein
MARRSSASSRTRSGANRLSRAAAAALAVEEGAEALAGAAGSAGGIGQTYVADVPQALIVQLEKIGVAELRTGQIQVGRAIGTLEKNTGFCRRQASSSFPPSAKRHRGAPRASPVHRCSDRSKSQRCKLIARQRHMDRNGERCGLGLGLTNLIDNLPDRPLFCTRSTMVTCRSRYSHRRSAKPPQPSCAVFHRGMTAPSSALDSKSAQTSSIAAFGFGALRTRADVSLPAVVCKVSSMHCGRLQLTAATNSTRQLPTGHTLEREAISTLSQAESHDTQLN